jgi:hypothetical protein
MSKVSLAGNASGTGIFTIASPNSNTDRTLTLPDSSGTIATTGQAVTPSQLPSGTIIQTQYYQSLGLGSGTSTSTSYVDDGVSIAITPLLSTSKLYVVCTTGCSVAGGYAYFRILENVSGAVLQEFPWGNFSGSPQQLDGFTMTGWYVPGNTTTRTFKLQGKCTSGTRYINYSMYPNITVYEVSA